MASSTSSSLFNPSEDPTSPYFLHHDDYPGMILVSQLLYGDNYNTWSRSMLMALTTNIKTGFVDGSIPIPTNSSNPQYSSWTRCNNIVLSWQLNSVFKEIAISIIFIDTTKEVWSDLKERFPQGNGPWIFQLQKSIASLAQD